MARLIKKGLLAAGCGVLLLTGVIAAPIVWAETTCKAETSAQESAKIITDPQDQRPEARTAFVVPEWEIVYAYEDYARILQNGPAHEFDYLPAISRFWGTLCAVKKEAERMGDPGAESKFTIYTIGASFTIEMLAKAVYEETIGRGISAFNNHEKTEQDNVELAMASEYGAFLHQTPWYRFNFAGWSAKLWDAPVEDTIRGWERRLALSAEWGAKQAYAWVITKAVGTMEPDHLMIKAHVVGLDSSALETLPHARLVSQTAGGMVLEVDRYRLFTETAKEIAAYGGAFTEIAGNDDILVSLLSRNSPTLPEGGKILIRSDRQGDVPDRFLVSIKVSHLTDLIQSLPPTSLEHIYDY